MYQFANVVDKLGPGSCSPLNHMIPRPQPVPIQVRRSLEPVFWSGPAGASQPEGSFYTCAPGHWVFCWLSGDIVAASTSDFGLCSLGLVCSCRTSAMAGRIPKAPLTGLAEEWEKCDNIRRRFVFEGKLLVWSKPAQTGIPSMQNAKLNFDVLLPLFHIWASSCTAPRTPRLAAVKKEAYI